ncbi:hypothetical protein Gotur_017737 [Gossypium turneri]
MKMSTLMFVLCLILILGFHFGQVDSARRHGILLDAV